MLNELVRFVVFKSIAKDLVTMAAKTNRHENVVKEKLGTDTIDEFMKMNVQEYQNKKGLS